MKTAAIGIGRSNRRGSSPAESTILRVAIWIVLGTLCILGPLRTTLHAQAYMTSTGSPSFAAPYPVEMGTVDAASGNLHLEIPLGSYPQRGGSTAELKIAYDSHLWSIQPGSNPNWMPYNAPLVLLVGGWQVLVSGTWLATQSPDYPGCTFDQEVWAPNGTSHWFRVSLGTGTLTSGCSSSSTSTYAVDSSGFELFVTYSQPNLTFTLYAPDGTLVLLEAPSSNSPQYPKDSNGNYMSDIFGGAGAGTDTLGRQFLQLPLSPPSCIFQSVHPGGSYSACYHILTSQGNYQQYTLDFADIPLKTDFQWSHVAECVTNCWITVLTGINLPDGSSYSFLYDCDSSTRNPACNSPGGQNGYYGTVTSMTLPTGQTITYGYSMYGGVSWGNGSNEFPSRWLTSKSSSQGSWSYTPSATAGAGPDNTCLPNFQVGCAQTVVRRPDGSEENLTFIVDPVGGAWPQTSRSYDINSGTLLSTVNNTWDFSTLCTLNSCFKAHPLPPYVGYQNVRRLSTSTTLNVPGGSITKQTTYTYDSPQRGNVTAVKEWKYRSGAAPTFPPPADRATYITYATIGTNNNINRPLSATVCNNVGTDLACPGGGTRVAQTNVTYDAYGSNGSLALASVTGVANHDDGGFGTAYLTRGNPTQIARWVSGSTFLTTSLSYDTTGQVIKALDPAGNVTTFSYADNFYNDNGANPPQTFTPANLTNAYATTVTDNIGSTATGYYYGSGRQAIATDYDAVSTYAHYMDPFDRPTETDYPIGWLLAQYHLPVQGQTQLDSYSAVGDAAATPTCASCTHIQTILDGFGRATTQSSVNNPAGQVNVSASYDSLNRVLTASHPNFGATDPNDVVETSHYDGLGRSLGVTHPDNERTQLFYGSSVTNVSGALTSQQGSSTTYGLGFPVVSVDEAGKPRQQWIDGFGKVIEVDEPGPVLSTPFVTNYTYDALGNLTSVVQGSQTRNYRYDGLSRLTQEATPEAGTVTLSYVTTAGALCSGNPSNPCTRTAPAPNQTGSQTVTTTYTYNAANQLTQKTHSDTTGTEVYTYGTSAANFNVGRVTKMTDPSGSEVYYYDKIGRLTTVNKFVGSTNYPTKYAYDTGSDLTKVTYPSGRVVYYNYDHVGHLCQVATATSSTCSSTTPYLSLPSSSYDAASRPLSATYGNGVVATASYSSLSAELVSLSYAKGTTTLFGLNYYYQQDSTHCPAGNAIGNNGQIQCITDTVQPGRSVSYTYDSLGRLSTANTTGSTAYPAWGLSETYDRYGNRTAQTVTAGSGYNSSFTINSVNNRITSPAFTYDASGNVIGEPAPLTATHTYDGEECNTGYTGNGNSASYTCDGNGLRVKKVVTGTNAVTTVSIRSDGQVIAEYDNGAAVTSPTREYLYGNNLLATVTGSTGGSGGTITYQHRDHLSPRLYTDVNGNDVGERGTYPFGESWYSKNTTSNWVFTSYERDQESGNDYALARSYTNGQGRFLAPDPLEGAVGDPQSWNRYAYVENDPINLSDPNGQGFWSDLFSVFVDLFNAFTGGGFDGSVSTQSLTQTPCSDPSACFGTNGSIVNSTVIVTVGAAACAAGVCYTGGGGGGDGPGSGRSAGSDSASTGSNPEGTAQTGAGGPGAQGTDPGRTDAGSASPGGAGTASPGSGSPAPGGGGNIWDECGNICGSVLVAASNFSAGAGSALTLGLTDLVNHFTGAGKLINRKSGWYWAGVGTGTAVGVGLSGPEGPLFGARFKAFGYTGRGFFNSLNSLRVGWSFMGAPQNFYRFRIAGTALGPLVRWGILNSEHINLWPPQLWGW